MERIHVSVRTRPLSAEDARSSPWRISGNSIFIPNHSSKFDFDRIFDEECSTKRVYEARTRDIVAAAVQGFNGTVFAYGQTNSGKTHTMRGSNAELGVIPLSVHDLFETIRKEPAREFLLRMSYMEIYNEEINDLLAPEHRKLQIHENPERGIFVAGLREEIIVSPEQVLDLMEFGEVHRHIGETNMNVHSSRSHTIFRMIIESRDRTCDDEAGNICDAIRVSVLNLVDLAGSERAAKTGAEGIRLKEGSHINKSLMTLGTVIKKLSESAESQGGHVPYRDSKLTRILQPALGGNSNTAIICNITLAQVHADETKSSLQFASRAIRVTNFAHVNEILTDAALLKRQKKEIEELRAKLQGSHSEHLEEEILSLRNTLLQTELERERIALELEEEKKAKAEDKRRLKEQARKIENLSTMVLYSSRNESQDAIQKDRRRDTWCPGIILKEFPASKVVSLSPMNSMRAKRETGSLMPFKELIQDLESCPDQSFKRGREVSVRDPGGSILPNPSALMHVTNRRKVLVKQKNAILDFGKSDDLHEEIENLLMEFEAHRIASDIHIDCLVRKLAETAQACHPKQEDFTKSPTELEAHIMNKQLKDQENSRFKRFIASQLLFTASAAFPPPPCSSRNGFDDEEFFYAQKGVQVALEGFASEFVLRTEEGVFSSMVEFSLDVKDIILEFQAAKGYFDDILSIMDEFFQLLSTVSSTLTDYRAASTQILLQQKLIVSGYWKIHDNINQKVTQFETEKVQSQNDCNDLHNRILDLEDNVASSERALLALKEQSEEEKMELFAHIQELENELSYFSSSVMVKEKESMRKELEKTKLKLKETENKLRNVVQEKTKLEGEKASAEKELKLLHSQKSLLERDINRKESLASRQRDSMAIDSKKPKGLLIDPTIQDAYSRLEFRAFEMEATIASLEEELAVAHEETGEVMQKCESLASELTGHSDKISSLNLELTTLHEEVADLTVQLDESKTKQEKLRASLDQQITENEELANQLANSLLEMEEERALWLTKERASAGAMEEKDKLYNLEIISLRKDLQNRIYDLTNERDELNAQTEELQKSLIELEMKFSDARAEVHNLSGQISAMEVKSHHDEVNNGKEKSKLRMRLHWTQAKLDATRNRYTEVVDKQDLIHRKFSEASRELKDRLRDCATENLNLRKELAVFKGA